MARLLLLNAYYSLCRLTLMIYVCGCVPSPMVNYLVGQVQRQFSSIRIFNLIHAGQSTLHLTCALALLVVGEE